MTITVLTANWNSGNKLRTTWESLLSQNDSDFYWIIKDNNSTDESLQLALDIADSDARVSVYQSADSGIYDALNQLVNLCQTDFYVVLGAEDILYNSAVATFNKCILTHKYHKLFFFSCYINGRKFSSLRFLGFLFGMRGCASCHSVATLINKELHSYFGFYSTSLRLLSDQLFIKSCVYSNVPILRSSIAVGEFAVGGSSSLKPKTYREEFLYVQLETEKFAFLQRFLFFLRSVFRPV